ncbi:hypothetical protein H9P43_008077 [Blastocladiella emersonii ATCC 22665]|nr:hypothetical protein H9P43_008077 [Blastocladiella emersonii ATCC 22665]
MDSHPMQHASTAGSPSPPHPHAGDDAAEHVVLTPPDSSPPLPLPVAQPHHHSHRPSSPLTDLSSSDLAHADDNSPCPSTPRAAFAAAARSAARSASPPPSSSSPSPARTSPRRPRRSRLVAEWDTESDEKENEDPNASPRRPLWLAKPGRRTQRSPPEEAVAISLPVAAAAEVELSASIVAGDEDAAVTLSLAATAVAAAVLAPLPALENRTTTTPTSTRPSLRRPRVPSSGSLMLLMQSPKRARTSSASSLASPAPTIARTSGSAAADCGENAGGTPSKSARRTTARGPSGLAAAAAKSSPATDGHGQRRRSTVSASLFR